MTTILRPSFHAEPLWPGARVRQVEHPVTAPSRLVQYVCPTGHAFDVPFAQDAEEIPLVGRCRRHHVDGKQVGREDEPAPKIKHGSKGRLGSDDGRTHYDRVLERRSRSQLQALLEERLADLARCRRAGVPPEPAPKGTNPGRHYS